MRIYLTYEFDKLRSLFVSSCVVRMDKKGRIGFFRVDAVDFDGGPRDVLYELYELTQLSDRGVFPDYDPIEGLAADYYVGNRDRERYLEFSVSEFGWRELFRIHERFLPVYKKFVGRYGFEDSRENQLENCRA